MKTILLTDAPELPKDNRCPRCQAGPEWRRLSQSFGPLHDVCGGCGYAFRELTVPVSEQEAGEEED